jgi:hypothetical protein
MKLFFKSFGLTFMLMLCISCARPAIAQDYCYAGVSAGVSYASDQYINKLENRAFEIVNQNELALRHTEKKWGQPYELFTGCRKGMWAGEVGVVKKISAAVKTNATFQIAGQTYSGDVNRVADVEGISISGLAYYRLSPRVEVYGRLGAVYASGIITAALPLPHEFDGGVIAYQKKAWLPRIGIGLQGRLGERTDWRAEVGAIGTPKVPIGMFGLSQHF